MEWREGPDLPLAMAGMAAVQLSGDSFLLTGGISSTEEERKVPLDDVYLFNKDYVWHEIPSEGPNPD